MAASLIKPSSLGLAVMGNHPPAEEVAGLLSDSSSPEICHLLDFSHAVSCFYYCSALRDSATRSHSFWLGSQTQFIPNFCHLVEASLEFWNNNWLKAHGNNHTEINRQLYNLAYMTILLLIFCLLELSLSHSCTAIIFVIIFTALILFKFSWRYNWEQSEYFFF